MDQYPFTIELQLLLDDAVKLIEHLKSSDSEVCKCIAVDISEQINAEILNEAKNERREERE